MVKLNNPSFSFNFICQEEIVIEIGKSSNKKASQITDTPVNIVKENKDIVSYFLHRNFNYSLPCFTFLEEPRRHFKNKKA